MSIVITGSTGNVGSAVTRALLDAGEKPVLIVRDPKKSKGYTSRGAVAKEGSHGDADSLIEATRGAKALFVMTPDNMQTQNIRGHYQRFAEAAAKAIQANNIPLVVHLSSLGAELETGNGVVSGLHAAEQILNDAGAANLIHLRPAYFMENTLMQIPNILQANSLFTTFPEGRKISMVAIRDIGARAAELLHKRHGRGTQVVELLGKSEISFEEVADSLSKALNRDIKHTTVSDEQLKGALTAMGFSPVMADGMTELSNAQSTGLIHPHEVPGAANTGATPFAAFVEQVFKPLFDGAAAN